MKATDLHSFKADQLTNEGNTFLKSMGIGGAVVLGLGGAAAALSSLSPAILAGMMINAWIGSTFGVYYSNPMQLERAGDEIAKLRSQLENTSREMARVMADKGMNPEAKNKLVSGTLIPKIEKLQKKVHMLEKKQIDLLQEAGVTLKQAAG